MSKARTYKARQSGSRATVEVVVPTVVGVTQAAEMLGVPKSNISRLRSQGRMPEPVPQEGPGAPVWLKPEVEELAKALAAERTARRGE